MAVSRRGFIAQAGLLGGALVMPAIARATPGGTPPGLQLWAVQDVIRQDFEGTLRALPAIAAGRLFVRDDTTLACLEVGR